MAEAAGDQQQNKASVASDEAASVRGKKRKKPGAGNAEEEEEAADLPGVVKMQTTDAVRVAGLSADLNQQITKFDSSEFDVSPFHLPTK